MRKARPALADRVLAVRRLAVIEPCRLAGAAGRPAVGMGRPRLLRPDPRRLTHYAGIRMPDFDRDWKFWEERTT